MAVIPGDPAACYHHSGIKQRLDDVDKAITDHESRLRDGRDDFEAIRDSIKSLRWRLWIVAIVAGLASLVGGFAGSEGGFFHVLAVIAKTAGGAP